MNYVLNDFIKSNQFHNHNVDKNNINLSNLIKRFDGDFIFNVYLEMFLSLIKMCPPKIFQNY